MALVYHRVCDTRLDPLLLGVSPRNFDEQMRVLAERATPLDAASFARRAVQGSLPQRAVCVTFDDGYADNLHVAAPILERHQVPGCVFVSTGLVADGRESWWDAVEHVAVSARATHGPVQLSDNAGELEVSFDDEAPDSLESWNVEQPDRTSRQSGYRRLLSWLHNRAPDTIDRHLKTLFDWVGCSRHSRPIRRFMSVSEVRLAAASPQLALGGHTVRHPVLSTLSQNDQEREIAECRARLAEWTGREPTVFAYPFGTCDQYQPVTRRLVARAGFPYAFSNMPGPATHVNPLEIPRLIVRDWDGATFARRIGLA